MVTVPAWIVGESQSGKTTHLIEQLQRFRHCLTPSSQLTSSAALIFSANSQNRMKLADRIWEITEGNIPFYSTTTLVFFQDEVILFWPLLVQGKINIMVGCVTHAPYKIAWLISDSAGFAAPVQAIVRQTS